MKTMSIPFIEGLEEMGFEDLKDAMDAEAAHDVIGTLNWPEEFPHRPQVGFSVARSRTHIAILYNVKGQGIRATVLEDNGPVWQDSCCEFFVEHPSDGTYYNFEMNCIGHVLAAKRKSRTDFKYLSETELSRLVRHTGFERKPVEDADQEYSWSMALCIPFDLIGLNADNLPETIRANFYKCADYSAHPHYLSWSPIDTPAPDFHRPEFFGTLILGNA